MFESLLSKKIWNRRFLLLPWFILLSLAVVSFGFGQGSTISAPAADEIHWTLISPTAVTFDWRGTAATVSYGLAPGTYTRSATASPSGTSPFSSEGPFQEARITDLQPNTLYYYSVEGGSVHTFRTPPAPGGSGFTIFVEGDIGATGSYPSVAGVQALIAKDLPAFALLVGDLTYGNPKGQGDVDEHFNDVMVWSQVAAYMPTWGNHEWDKPADDLRNYKGRFDLPNPQTSPDAPSAGCCGKDWYWFDYGNVRFIVYPEPYSSAVWADWKTMAETLMDQAQGDPNIQFIVTAGHRPAYSSGHHPGSANLKKILDELGANHNKYLLNLNGHSHNYERTHPQQGVTHVTVGTGGGTLETDGTCKWLTCEPPDWSAFRAFHYGALKLAFAHNGIKGSFICGPASSKDDVICPEGSVLDNFVIKTLAVPPRADACVRSASPDRNYGNAKLLFAGKGPASTATSYLRFRVKGVEGTVRSARLRLYARDGTIDGSAVYPTSNNWSESGITWNNAPVATGAAIDAKNGIPAKTWIEYDVTAFVTGNGVYNFILAGAGPDILSFSSLDGKPAPRLTVTCMP
jgi:hypothetical protein